MIKTQTIFALLVYLMIFDGNKAAEFTQFKLIRGKGKAYRTEILPRYEDLEYPRRNGKILQILKKMWDNYYSCLYEKEKQDTKSEIRRLLEGQNTELKCDFCPRPFQDYEEIQWKYKSLSPDTNITELEYLDLTPQMAFTTEKTLQIFNAIESFAGLYVCFHQKSVLSIYILEVSKNDTTERVEKMRSDAIFFEKLGNNFYVHYQWTGYTECSSCKNVGKKYKYGTCYVSSTSNTDEELITQNSKNVFRSKKQVIQESLSAQTSRQFTDVENKTTKVDQIIFEIEIFKKFPNGIPCASPYLMNIFPDILKNVTAVKVIVKYCWEPCQENKIFEVVDSSGRIVEWANNTAGIYSLFQKLPNIPLGIERRTEVAEFGSSITIVCPGTSLTNTPVVWKVNDKIVYPEIISNRSNGRFTVDLVNRIHIKKLRLRDGQIYSCWHKDRLVGTVHLNVEKKFKIGFNHHVTLIGIIAIVGTFLTVGSKILTRELQLRRK